MDNETNVIYIHPQKRIISQKEEVFLFNVYRTFFS